MTDKEAEEAIKQLVDEHDGLDGDSEKPHTKLDDLSEDEKAALKAEVIQEFKNKFNRDEIRKDLLTAIDKLDTKVTAAIPVVEEAINKAIDKATELSGDAADAGQQFVADHPEPPGTAYGHFPKGNVRFQTAVLTNAIHASQIHDAIAEIDLSPATVQLAHGHQESLLPEGIFRLEDSLLLRAGKALFLFTAPPLDLPLAPLLLLFQGIRQQGKAKDHQQHRENQISKIDSKQAQMVQQKIATHDGHAQFQEGKAIGHVHQTAHQHGSRP